MSIEVRILGPMEVVGEDGPLDLGGPRRRSVLALLALEANSVVSIDRLADALYGEAPPATAVTQVQRQVSDLRKQLGTAIETRAPGYLLRLDPGRLDLERFERLAADGSAALQRGEHATARGCLRDALALWRGRPFADLADEPFAAMAAARLDDLRLAALERRVEADLALGAHQDVVGELEALVREHPAREGFGAQLMVALYRCGRQSDALRAFRELRTRLVDLYGIEPTPALRALEAAVLRQDPALDAPMMAAPASTGAVLVSSREASRLGRLAELAAPLAAATDRELLLLRLLGDTDALGAAAAAVARLRAALRVPARGTAFVTSDVAGDLGRFATDHEAALLLVDAPEVADGGLAPELAALLEDCPADVALVAGEPGADDGRVLVAFGGGEHDWAALELGAWLAAATGGELALAGPSSSAGASRALAAASLAVQRTVGIDAAPLLVDAGGLAGAAAGARAAICGLPPDWRRNGIGGARASLVRGARAPVLLVHRGPRPGGLAPPDSATRFTWSLG